jgi:hypothetical protein
VIRGAAGMDIPYSVSLQGEEGAGRSRGLKLSNDAH